MVAFKPRKVEGSLGRNWTQDGTVRPRLGALTVTHLHGG